MQMQKFFNPLLVGKTFLPSLFGKVSSEASWWKNKNEARKYANSLAEGLTLWSTVDIIVLLTLIVVSFFVSLPPTLFGLFIIFAIGSPIIMTVGIVYGCLKHLSLTETWTIIRNYFLE